MSSQAAAPEVPWHAAFPAPKASFADGTLASLTTDELHHALTASETTKASTLIVDVRRTDFEVRSPFPRSSPTSSSSSSTRRRAAPLTTCLLFATDGLHSRGSQPAGPLVLPDAAVAPAHPPPVRPSAPLALPLLLDADELTRSRSRSYRTVVFHCQSSNGRGPRCAGWYQDALDESGVSHEESKAVVLTGGIKAWIERYGEDDKLTARL